MIDPFHYATRAATLRKQAREETAALIAGSHDAIRRSRKLLDQVATDRSFEEMPPSVGTAANGQLGSDSG